MTPSLDWPAIRRTIPGDLAPIVNATERILSERFLYTRPGSDWADGAWFIDGRSDGSELWLTNDGDGFFFVVRPPIDPATGEYPDGWTEALLCDAWRPALVRRWLRAGCPIPLSVRAPRS